MGELTKRAEEIRDEVRVGGNTALRVGGLMVDMAALLEGKGLDGLFVEMLKRHIDNDTVYWDEDNKVIKAKGGGGGEGGMFTITVDMDESQGIRGEILPAKVNTVKEGDSLTVTINPKAGFEVQRVNVDKVNKGAITSYTFDNVQEDHTMYVWFQTEAQANPVDWLERSDLPGVYYSSLQDAFNAVKATYSEKLTQDVTIRCVKEATYKRTLNPWMAELAHFNKNSMYTLSIDGASLMTLDCKSLGGIRFDHVDNVVCSSIDFLNFSNYLDAGSPEELSAINIIGDVDSVSGNIYIERCTMNGGSSWNSAAKGNFAIIGKYVGNVYVVDNDISNVHVMALKMQDCSILSLVKNTIVCDHSWGYAGHPMLCMCTNGRAIIAEDNTFSGSSGENYFQLTNMDRIRFRRNRFMNGGGRVAEITSKMPTKELTIESNLMVGMLAAPIFGWIHEFFTFGDIDKLNIVNNTIYMNSDYYMQRFIYSGNATVNEMNLYNNIICGITTGGSVMNAIGIGKVNTYNAGHNIYQFPLRDDGITAQSGVVFFNKPDGTGVVGYNKISEMIAAGYETEGSVLVGNDVKVLDADYVITASYNQQYKADDARSVIDVEYKRKAATGNSLGCSNLAGVVIDEVNDTSTGYTGEDLSEIKDFSNDAQYTTLADSVLLVRHKTLNRSKFIRISATGSQHTALILGRYGLMTMHPELDADGQYKADELYTINIG